MGGARDPGDVEVIEGSSGLQEGISAYPHNRCPKVVFSNLEGPSRIITLSL